MLKATSLIGFGDRPRVVAPPALTTISQQASATDTDNSVNCPAVIAGDLILVLNVAEDSGVPPTNTTPSGFTQIFTATGNPLNFYRITLSAKIATGSEGGAAITGFTGNQMARIVVLTFRGDIPISLATPSTPVSPGWVTGNPTSQTVLSAAGVAPLVVLGVYGGGNLQVINPRTFTVGGVGSKDGEVNASTELYLAWKIYNTAPADVVVDMDDEGAANYLAGLFFACS